MPTSTGNQPVAGNPDKPAMRSHQASGPAPGTEKGSWLGDPTLHSRGLKQGGGNRNAPTLLEKTCPATRKDQRSALMGNPCLTKGCG